MSISKALAAVGMRVLIDDDFFEKVSLVHEYELFARRLIVAERAGKEDVC